MAKWKTERNGSIALLINGARRVGKSTIAEEFAKNEYKSYIPVCILRAIHSMPSQFYFEIMSKEVCLYVEKKRLTVVFVGQRLKNG